MDRPTDEELLLTIWSDIQSYISSNIEREDVAYSIDQVRIRMRELREQLTGRTMHCGMCEDYAKQAAELRDAIREWARWDKGSHGGSTNWEWAKPHKRLHKIADTGIAGTGDEYPVD